MYSTQILYKGKRMAKKKAVSRNFRLTEQEDQALADIAERRGVSRTQVVRQWILREARRLGLIK